MFLFLFLVLTLVVVILGFIGVVGLIIVFLLAGFVCFLVLLSCNLVLSDCIKLLAAKEDSPSLAGTIYNMTLHCLLLQGCLLVWTVLGAVLYVGCIIFLCVSSYSFLIALVLVFVWMVVGLGFAGIVQLGWYCFAEEVDKWRLDNIRTP